jgi:hypothetical protein
MSTLTITIGIVALVITFLIGRYFRSEKIKQLIDDIEDAMSEFSDLQDKIGRQSIELAKEISYLKMQIAERERIASKALAELDTLNCNIAFVQIVPNINPHHAADKEYIGIYPNNGLEPAHLTREEYQKGVDRLKDNPEDKAI